MTYPNGRVLNYNYNPGLDDSISRLSSISDSSGTLEAYKYLGLDTIVERDHPQNGVNLTYISQNNSTGDAGDQYTGLDRFGRIVEQAWLNTQTTTLTDDFLYSYDRDSNVLTNNNGLNSSLNQTFTYDNLNRLTTYARANGDSQTYTLNATGGFSSVAMNGDTDSRTNNAQNQAINVGGNALTFDNNGNVTSDQNGQQYVCRTKF